MRGIACVALALAGCGREPVFAEDDPLFAYELPEVGEECATDPDCPTNGCGQYCTAADAESFVSSCEWPSELDGAECGCIQGRCRWGVRYTLY
jgi:hypothetical protein